MSAVTGFEAGVIDVVVDRIVRLVAPIKVILFGSRARGDARPDSDFDLLVVRESDKPRHERSAPIYTALADLPVEVEVMVYTPAEIEEWKQVPEAFVTTAIREGKVLHERAEQPDVRLAQEALDACPRESSLQ